MKLRILTYATSFFLTFFFISYLFYFIDTQAHRPISSGIVEKMRLYSTDKDDYDMIFLGDSRTFCAVHPELIDARLGSHSINMAHWSNWLPSQYVMFQDIIKLIPKGTTVVWGIGKGNFQPNTIASKYPLRIKDLAHFIRIGIDPIESLNAYLAYTPLFSFTIHCKRIYDSIDNRLLTRSILSSQRSTQASPSPAPIQLQSVLDAEKNLHVLTQSTVLDNSKATSIEIFTTRGGYCRVEIDKPFFRKKQQRPPLTRAEIEGYILPPPSPAYWTLFDEMLDLFELNGINLVVCVFDEAPHSYRHPAIRQRYHDFFQQTVREKVEEHGFPLVYPNQKLLNNTQYFDYNHMNWSGINAFTPLLVDSLKPYYQQ